MTEERKQQMLEKVRKLLRLAASANEHEAALAAEKAQEILATYNLSMEEVKTDTESEDLDVGVEVGGITNRRPWRRPLAQAVAKMYFCQYFYQNLGKDREQHSFVGSKANSAVAIMMFQYLNKAIDRLAKDGALKHPKEERSRFRISFRATCSQRVTQRIYNRIRDAKEGKVTTSEGRNLPALLNMFEKWDALNKAFTDQQYGKMRTRKSVITAKHAIGAAEGWSAGDKIGLDPQVGGHSSAKRLTNS